LIAFDLQKMHLSPLPQPRGFILSAFCLLNSIRLTFHSSQNDIPFVSKCYPQFSNINKIQNSSQFS